jgi:6-pyruvoyltetrahydropterin/6-carboxytetrahydropterin synthase
MEFEVSQFFTFDGAHHLTKEHREYYGDLHGHSWTSSVTITGEKSEKEQWVIDFEQFEQALKKVALLLDHKYHNEIEGLETPSMENMSLWIAEAVWTFLAFQRLHSSNLRISAVSVQRSTLGETVTYRPTHLQLRPNAFAQPKLDIDFGALYQKAHKKAASARKKQEKTEAAELKKQKTIDARFAHFKKGKKYWDDKKTRQDTR